MDYLLIATQLKENLKDIEVIFRKRMAAKLDAEHTANNINDQDDTLSDPNPQTASNTKDTENDEEKQESVLPTQNAVNRNNSEYPSTILAIIHGFKDEIKHQQLLKATKALGINFIIPSKSEDTKELSHSQRVELYKNLILKHDSIEMIIGQSSGGNVISSLVIDEGIWNGPTWIISARLIEKIYKNKHEDLPILFSHGIKDNLSYMEGLCANKFSRCKLMEFEGDHYAQDLFVGDDAIENLQELIRICYALRLAKPKKLKDKMSLAEMMQQKFASKNDSI